MFCPLGENDGRGKAQDLLPQQGLLLLGANPLQHVHVPAGGISCPNR